MKNFSHWTFAGFDSWKALDLKQRVSTFILDQLSMATECMINANNEKRGEWIKISAES
jgi:hypothetical protein